MQGQDPATRPVPPPTFPVAFPLLLPLLKQARAPDRWNGGGDDGVCPEMGLKAPEK